jgi:squalene synthase HpnC
MSALLPGIDGLPTREQVLPQAASENFTVASAVLGPSIARHLMSIYGFARLVDDVGDEADGDRSVLLELVGSELARIYEPGLEGPPRHPLMRELAVTIHACSLPAGPFERLIAANRQDQTFTHYATFQQLLDYCRLSAAPVGELVLGVFAAATPARIALSDRICAGLQIVEHLQDIAEDHSRGRVYMPLEDMARFGCTDADLAAAAAPTPALRALISFEGSRARALIGSGAPLARTLPLRPRLAVAGFVAGGRRALDELEHGAERLSLLRRLPRAVAGR